MESHFLLTEPPEDAAKCLLKRFSEQPAIAIPWLASMSCYLKSTGGKSSLRQYLNFASENLGTEIKLLDYSEPEKKPEKPKPVAGITKPEEPKVSKLGDRKL